jgi:hypothetical protein
LKLKVPAGEEEGRGGDIIVNDVEGGTTRPGWIVWGSDWTIVPGEQDALEKSW